MITHWLFFLSAFAWLISGIIAGGYYIGYFTFKDPFHWSNRNDNWDPYIHLFAFALLGLISLIIIRVQLNFDHFTLHPGGSEKQRILWLLEDYEPFTDRSPRWDW